MGEGHILAMVQRQDNGAIEANLGPLFAGVPVYHKCHVVIDGQGGFLEAPFHKRRNHASSLLRRLL